MDKENKKTEEIIRLVYLGKRVGHNQEAVYMYGSLEDPQNEEKRFLFNRPLGTIEISDDLILGIYKGPVTRNGENIISATNAGSWRFTGTLHWQKSLYMDMRSRSISAEAKLNAISLARRKEHSGPIHECTKTIKKAMENTNNDDSHSILTKVIKCLQE